SRASTQESSDNALGDRLYDAPGCNPLCGHPKGNRTFPNTIASYALAGMRSERFTTHGPRLSPG
ncbi:MAG: hypothetical protein ABIQ99_06640, partial [Thermoflexales bacterium]